MAKTEWAKGVPLDAGVQENLRALIRERGHAEAAALIGIGKDSVVRAAAGAGVRKATAIAIEARLREISRPAA